MSHDLKQITTDLGSTHKNSKELEKKLKDYRAKFFEAIDETILSSETLAQQTVSIPEGWTSVEVVAYVKSFYPGWRAIESDCNLEGGIDVLIEEDPSFKKFTYVNHDDGNVYRRNVSQAGPSLDDARLKAEDPKLWERITETKMQKVTVLREIDSLPNDDLAAMQEYFVPGPMTVKLDAPRKAKPDELDA